MERLMEHTDWLEARVFRGFSPYRIFLYHCSISERGDMSQLVDRNIHIYAWNNGTDVLFSNGEGVPLVVPSLWNGGTGS
jgi:hypothetical protein